MNAFPTNIPTNNVFGNVLTKADGQNLPLVVWANASSEPQEGGFLRCPLIEKGTAFRIKSGAFCIGTVLRTPSEAPGGVCFMDYAIAAVMMAIL